MLYIIYHILYIVFLYYILYIIYYIIYFIYYILYIIYYVILYIIYCRVHMTPTIFEEVDTWVCPLYRQAQMFAGVSLWFKTPIHESVSIWRLKHILEFGVLTEYIPQRCLSLCIAQKSSFTKRVLWSLQPQCSKQLGHTVS